MFASFSRHAHTLHRKCGEGLGQVADFRSCSIHRPISFTPFAFPLLVLELFLCLRQSQYPLGGTCAHRKILRECRGCEAAMRTSNALSGTLRRRGILFVSRHRSRSTSSLSICRRRTAQPHNSSSNAEQQTRGRMLPTRVSE